MGKICEKGLLIDGEEKSGRGGDQRGEEQWCLERVGSHSDTGFRDAVDRSSWVCGVGMEKVKGGGHSGRDALKYGRVAGGVDPAERTSRPGTRRRPGKRHQHQVTIVSLDENQVFLSRSSSDDLRSGCFALCSCLLRHSCLRTSI